MDRDVIPIPKYPTSGCGRRKNEGSWSPPVTPIRETNPQVPGHRHQPISVSLTANALCYQRDGSVVCKKGWTGALRTRLWRPVERSLFGFTWSRRLLNY
jgi:hypothetical protein